MAQMKKILIIECDPNLLRVMHIDLTRNGHDVKVAHDGIEGMELLNEESCFDLVITEIRMNGADGNQVAKYIKENEKMYKCPIIALAHYREDAENELFDSVLTKPFTMKDLRKAINSLL